MRRVLITGAAGNLGSKLRRHLESASGYELVLLDKQSSGTEAIVAADLSCNAKSWTDRFSGIDVVVHLAADPSPGGTWPSLVRNNVDVAINVFEAAIAHRVRRVVFASSLHAMLGYEREGMERVPVELDSYPIDVYGATKVFGERLGKAYADRHGLSVICLRLGWVQPRVDQPNADLQWRWLSDRDYLGYMERAIVVDDVAFAVVTATSAIAGSKWDLSESVRVLGYTPQDRFVPMKDGLKTTVKRKLYGFMKRQARRFHA